MTGVLILIVVLAIIGVLLFTPVYVEYFYSYDGIGKNKLRIKLLFLKKDIISEKKEINKKNGKKEKKKDKSKKSAKDIFESVKEIKRLYEYFKDDIRDLLVYFRDRAAEIKKVAVDIGFCTDDPMKTGIATGVLNGVVYNLLALVHNTVGIEDMSVNIQPCFEGKGYLHGKIHCIASVKIVHIIGVISKVLKMYYKYRKIVK